MIYTITLNPALDRTIEVENLIPEDANRIKTEARYAGGKGIDVSRVIKELRGESIALGFVGGYDGLEFEGRLIQEGVRTDFTKIQGEIRTNIIIYNRQKKTLTSLNASGPEIQPHELTLFFQKVSNLNPKPTFVVMSGSLPPGIPKDIYQRLSEILKDQGAKVVLDSDSESFKLGIKTNPFMIKPNLHEFERLFSKSFKSEKEIIAASQRLLADGIEVIAVSQGEKGVIVTSKEGSFRGIAPQIEAKSAVGAGDSLVAGFVFAFNEGRSITECVRLGVACGTAAALTPGTELVHKEDVERLYPMVMVERI